jgi:hypothetical protein
MSVIGASTFKTKITQKTISARVSQQLLFPERLVHFFLVPTSPADNLSAKNMQYSGHIVFLAS